MEYQIGILGEITGGIISTVVLSYLFRWILKPAFKRQPLALNVLASLLPLIVVMLIGKANVLNYFPGSIIAYWNLYRRESREGKVSFILVYFALILALFLVVLSSFSQSETPNDMSGTSSVQSNDSRTITELSSIYTLPKDEKPTIMTVSDITKLEDNPFFNNAQNVDIVVAYQINKLVILYRPAQHKVINASKLD